MISQDELIEIALVKGEQASCSHGSCKTYSATSSRDFFSQETNSCCNSSSLWPSSSACTLSTLFSDSMAAYLGPISFIFRTISSILARKYATCSFNSLMCCSFFILERLADSRFEIILFLFFSSVIFAYRPSSSLSEELVLDYEKGINENLNQGINEKT
ncbi:aromatic-L-amino-acid decarboxylase [Striga asiatica]|uniref:Aromatic-L-amino-acid decarboxylase n=1 Tax=Striga asiatica TaxID=4170 RepID=A0A5A7PL99_STRAF|nr:aromatic-L-amino-acid decarboxylase [Striga asiatica]